MGLRKEFQAAGNRTLYAGLANDLKVDTIIVKQVTIFNDFVDSWFSEPTHALYQYEFMVVNGQTTTSGFHKVV